jgi:hypothetical protein
MFCFTKNKTLDVHLFTVREDVFYNAQPKKASFFVPEWFKKLPKASFDDDPNAPLLLKKNIKTCPAFTTLYSSGFIIPLWSDLNIEVNGDICRYQFIDNESQVAFHSPKQIDGSEFAHTHIQMKLMSPWFMQTSEEVNMLFTAPTWNNFGHGDIVVAPGAFSSTRDPIGTNINLFLKRPSQRCIYQLFFNQPMLHIIPLTEKKIKLHHHLISQKELESLHKRSAFHLMELNRHRRASKLCPYEQISDKI